ncbi:MAG: DUF2058 family protein [Xanthomonadales bacterium]|nr:hypothetical protein [Xanthomonadales bacterium]MCC6592838.1 DUF2058 family protein [Xanthomonadales bacterium]MCE7930524.1 DUF2058 family protein [Xanthomonadales bacterium PRO6]
MSLSLRDQLLQAGFKPSVPESKPVTKAGARPVQGRHAGKPATGVEVTRRPPAPAKLAREGEPSLAHAYQIRAETEKREREEARRRAQEAAQHKREQRRKLAELVADKAQNDPNGEHARNFSYGRKIRKVNATLEQLHALNAGELGVVQVDGRFLILASEAVRAVLALAPGHVALFVPEGIGVSAGNDGDDYADPRFQVPDDLIW